VLIPLSEIGFCRSLRPQTRTGPDTGDDDFSWADGITTALSERFPELNDEALIAVRALITYERR
jgi:hypothetical protein